MADEALRKTLIAGHGNRIEFYSEYLDVSRFPGEFQDARRRDYFYDKYAGRQPDLIFAGGSAAADFLLKHRADLFSGVPVVYMDLTQSEIQQMRPDNRMIGIPISSDFAGTLDLALKLQPDTRLVAVVGGTSTKDAGVIASAWDQLAGFEKRVSFSWLTNQSISELQDTLSRLPEHSIVFYVVMFQDREGETFHPRDALTLLAPYSHAPIYGSFDTYVGYGIVGGEMVTFEEVGRKAGEVGLRILGGEEPAQALVGETHLPVPIFDWRELQRWGISPNRLPSGAEILFREPTQWEQHRWTILGSITLILVETALIAALILQLRKRLWAEALARESEQTARKLSGRLINAHEEERRRIARDLHDDLNQRLALLSVEMDSLGRSGAGKDSAHKLGELANQARDLSSDVHRLAYQLHPAKLDQLGLVAAVGSLCRELAQRSELKIDFTHHEVPRELPDETALCAFRVIQESLNNVIRHSGGKSATVELAMQAGCLWLRVKDAGKGFVVGPGRQTGGLGLLSMRERARLLDGNLNVHSEPNRGTEVELSLRLYHEEYSV
ncbi:MAG TPA: ABC transporter substrate binding protein [Verrucomicrobiae bacterium]|nr:ABC transporter substrate binding protein [Verrucomicrobiae bacterium]